MITLSTYYQCNGTQINTNDKGLETRFQVTCQASETGERGTEALAVEVSGGRTESVWESGAVLL